MPRSLILFSLSALLASSALVAAPSSAEARPLSHRPITSAVATQPSAAVAVAQPSVVSPVPSVLTPEVKNGRVQALAQVGEAIVVGGTFTSISDRGAPAVTRNYIAAYDRTTQQLLPGFAPVLDAQVYAVEPGPTQGTVFVGGSFTRVNGAAAARLALLDLATGAQVASFRPPAVNLPVRALARVGSRLYLGGVFSRVGGVPHGGLASLNADTGVIDPYVGLSFTEHHNYGRLAGAINGAVGIYDMAVTPDGRQLTAIGNFRNVSGTLRDQVAVIDLTTPTASLQQGWATSLFSAPCYYKAFDSWVRAVDYSPDGSYFVVGSTGGGNKDLCDAVARFGTADRGTDVRPTWIASTGGDSVFTVAATGAAVYAGGHFRWFNNPQAVDYAGPGAVPRPGIVALDVATGLPLSWNPGRHPRDKGAFAMLATDRELVVGTDTDWVGYREYFTPKLISFPLDGGPANTDTSSPHLPADLVLTASRGADADLTRVAATATSVSGSATSDAIAAFGLTRGAVWIGSRVYAACSDGVLRVWDASGGQPASPRVLDPYNDPNWSTLLTGVGGKTPTYRGVPSGFELEMPSLTSLSYREGRLYYTVAGSRQLRVRAFEPGSGVVSPEVTIVPTVDLPELKGGTYVDGWLYVVAASNGALYRLPFNGSTFSSAPELVDSPPFGRDWRSDALFLLPSGAAH